jgi:hypothetical protein
MVQRENKSSPVGIVAKDLSKKRAQTSQLDISED